MDREKLAENLLTIVPLMFKKLKKSFPAFEIPKQQLGLLFQISHEDGKPMSYYSEKMMVSKPNLTVMADKLIEEGFVERAFDASDRRIVILKITKKGEELLSEHKAIVRQEMAKILSLLDEKDVKRLNELIVEMKEIFNKIDQP